MASSPGGKLRPNAFAVLRLITNSNLIDYMTGRSAGFSPCCSKLSNDKRDTGDIAARSIETGDEAELDRVAAAYEDDRDRRSRRLGYN